MTNTHPGYTLEEWRNIRSRQSTFLEDVGTALGPLAGLTANAVAHLKRDWIIWRENHIRIDVPSTAPCNSYRLQPDTQRESPPPLEKSEEPCWWCREYGDSDQFENVWIGLSPRSGSSSRGQTAILHHDVAKPAVDILKSVFRGWGRDEIGATPGGIEKAVRLIGQSDDDENEYSKLLRTGPVLYCHHGLSKSEVADVTAFRESSVREIVAATDGVNFKTLPTKKFLKLIHEHEPVTVGEVVEEVGYAGREGARKRLKAMIEEDRVKIVEKPGGSYPYKYSTTELWDKPFTCSECSYVTYSKQAIGSHRANFCTSQ